MNGDLNKGERQGPVHPFDMELIPDIGFEMFSAIDGPIGGHGNVQFER